VKETQPYPSFVLGQLVLEFLDSQTGSYHLLLVGASVWQHELVILRGIVCVEVLI